VTRALVAISSLVLIVFAHVVGPPEGQRRWHPTLAINDIVALRRAVSHGAALERNRQVERECAPIRRARYTTFDQLVVADRVEPGPAFLERYLGQQLGEDDDTSVSESYPLTATRPPERPYQIVARTNHGIVDDLRAIVATHIESQCHAANDEAIECPPACHEDVLEACDALHARLNRVWGHEPSAIWKSDYTDVRATLEIDSSSCELVFERHVTTTRWMSLSATAEIPVGLLGRSVRWIPRRPYPYAIHRDEDGTLSWQAAATGEHIRGMRVGLTVSRGIIVGIRATGVQSDMAVEEIEAITRDLPVVVQNTDEGVVIVADASRVHGADR
jgi:hypothetical protein